MMLQKFYGRLAGLRVLAQESMAAGEETYFRTRDSTLKVFDHVRRGLPIVTSAANQYRHLELWQTVVGIVVTARLKLAGKAHDAAGFT
jgi:hypothetical protein